MEVWQIGFNTLSPFMLLYFIQNSTLRSFTNHNTLRYRLMNFCLPCQPLLTMPTPPHFLFFLYFVLFLNVYFSRHRLYSPPLFSDADDGSQPSTLQNHHSLSQVLKYQPSPTAQLSSEDLPQA